MDGKITDSPVSFSKLLIKRLKLFMCFQHHRGAAHFPAIYSITSKQFCVYSHQKLTSVRTLPVIVILSLLFHATAYAQSDSLSLPNVTVSGNRLQHELGSTSRSTTVISKKDIVLLPGQTPNDWMATVSGVDIRQRGPAGVQGDIGIRGGSFDQSLVLLNGMKLSDPQTGHHMLNLPLTNEAISQIEVIKTSSSRLYGINALTGSVNIVTKVPERNMAYLGGYGGDFGLYGLTAGVAFHTVKTGQHISFSRSQADGYKPNTDFNTNQLFYQLTAQAGKGSLNLIGGYTTRDFGAAGFYVVNSQEYEKTKTAFTGLQYDVRLNSWRIKAQTYFRYNEDEYVYIRSNPSFFRNLHFSHVAGAEMHVTYTSGLGETGAGIDVRTEQLSSSNLGQRERHIGGAFAEHRISLLGNRLTITPGVYVNVYSGNNTAAFPGIDASYRLGQHWLVFASADKGMRLPTFTDLYYNGPSNTGNPSLAPEEAVTTETGIKFSRTTFYASVAGFSRRSENLIDWARTDAAQKWQPLNVNDAVFRGVEANLVKSFPRIVRQVSLSYTFIDAQFNQPENYTSRYTLTNIRHQLIGTFRFTWIGNLYQTITVRHIERVTLPGYTLTDSKLGYQFTHFSVYADVSNIFNTSYTEAGFVTMPGRWFRVGFDIRLNY
jgi:vitamin B12 transporter